jgi:cell wall-associated NlpC family hydrolase
LPESVKKKSVQHLEHAVKTYIGTPYKYGGMSRSGVDCSGFVSLVFQEVYGKPLPRSARDMWRVGVQVPIAAARPGDLIFFKGGSFSTIDHVGIYLGNNKFAHASSSVGVTYSNAKDTYYARRLAGVKRVL